MQENNNQNANTEEVDINHLMQIRRDKLAELQKEGKNPYEITKFNRTNMSQQLEELQQKELWEKHHFVPFKIAKKKFKVM